MPANTKKVRLEVEFPSCGLPFCDAMARIIDPALKAVVLSPRGRMGKKWIPRLNKKVGPLLLWDWRDVAIRYLRRRTFGMPVWLYKGGRHIAVIDSETNHTIARIVEQPRKRQKTLSKP